MTKRPVIPYFTQLIGMTDGKFLSNNFRGVKSLTLLFLTALILCSCIGIYEPNEPEYKTVLQQIKSPDGKYWYVMLGDYAGIGDPSWHVQKHPVSTNVKQLKVSRDSNDPKDLFWNYSEAGDHTENPSIKIVNDRYIVFSRGGLYHSLYDIRSNQIVINDKSPWHTFRDDSIEPSPSGEEEDKMFHEWKIKNLHNPIKAILDKDNV